MNKQKTIENAATRVRVGDGAFNFPMSFWNYTNIEHIDAGCVKDWADAGMTAATSPHYNGTNEDHVRRMREILDAAGEAGIKVFLMDHYTDQGYLAPDSWQAELNHFTNSHWQGDASGHFTGGTPGEDGYRRHFEKALKDFGEHPATFGFGVGDEPNEAQMPHFAEAHRIQHDMAPHLVPFLNHAAARPREADALAAWTAGLRQTIETSSPDVISYDVYSQLDPWPSGLHWYYQNIQYYVDLAAEYGIPAWNCPLTVAEEMRMAPTEDQYRWQINTAAAHGIRGLTWFFMYAWESCFPAGYVTGSPPINEYWERTRLYEYLSYFCRQFRDTIGPTMSRLTLTGVSHYGEVYGEYPAFDGSGFVTGLDTPNIRPDNPLVFSEFVDPDNRPYLMVTNNSQHDNSWAAIQLRDTIQRAWRITWKGAEQGISRHGEKIFMAPGDAALYRLEVLSKVE